MKVTIDNHDGLGAVDYTSSLAATNGLSLVRKLNLPTVSTFKVDCNATGHAIPAKYGRVTVSADSGLVLFTGYVALTPEAVLVGAGIRGLMYVQDVTAISDEILLDQQSVPVTAASAGVPVAQLMQNLTLRVDPTRFTFVTNAINANVGSFVAEAGESWSVNAGALAALARAGYRVINGQVSVLPIGGTIHTLSDTAGTLDPGHFSISQAKMLANDMTVCGESEPQAYVTDVFQGDGTTTTFVLTRLPLHVGTLKGRLVSDSFSDPSFDPVVWQTNDPGSRLSITSAGLTVNGGNGLDGQTTLTAISNVEMGGDLTLTAGGVLAASGSSGYVGCLYNGSVLLANLFAGFFVTQSSGNTVVSPVINGAQIGSSSTLVSGHAYSFRLRYACSEMQRVLASYYITGATGPQLFGGGLVVAPAQLVLEVQDTTGGVNQPPVVLYDGAVTQAPATCILCAINSLAFTGSIQSIALEQSGAMWVRSLQTSGSAFTRRLGTATEGADCKVETTGKLVFYPASVPQAGELITVTYRTVGKAVARLVNTASVLSSASSVIPGVSRWIGSVTKPAARSSADCENAALALLAVSTSVNAAWSGKYKSVNLHQSGDVWPGDVLAVQSAGLALNASLIVKTVTVTYYSEQPETLGYAIDFANDWADAISVKTSNTVPKDVWLPQAAVGAPSSLQSLLALSVTVTSSQINVTTGVNAPSGGGFEVRRVDWQFGPGSDGTLVLRSPVANFTIVREAAVEQYFVRMYDASTPPNYSRFSSEICASVPL